MIGRGERLIDETLVPLGGLRAEEEGAHLLATLECFLLDAEMSITRTAEKLYVHKNTIKYRIQRIADRLGFIPGTFPDTLPVYTACALNRLDVYKRQSSIRSFAPMIFCSNSMT